MVSCYLELTPKLTFRNDVLVDLLYCGVKQSVVLDIDPGRFELVQGEQLEISSSKHLQLSLGGSSLQSLTITNVIDGKVVLNLETFHEMTTSPEAIAFVS